ncbi:sialoadhesin-like [Clarias gariepinus]
MMFLKTAYRNLLCLIFLLIITGALGNVWSGMYSRKHLCALKGSTVFMNVSYTHPTGLTVTQTFWFINPVQGTQETDLRNEPGYSDRVEYLGDEQKHFSLRLSDVKKTDENVYYFRIITNVDKERWTGFPGVTLTVTDLQVIAPAEVTEGQSAVLTCKTTCSLTDPTFIWYKNSRNLTTNTIKSNKVHLQSVSSEDAGSYSCAVRGYKHLPSPAHTLRVRYPPKNVSVSISPSGEIVEDSSVTLTCSSDANPPVEIYTWFKEMTSIGNEKTYTISNISSEDSGEYKCRCSNEVGHQDSSSVTLNVLYRPKNVFVSISPSCEIVEGSSVTLTCSSDANPPVEIYTWFKVNEFSAVGSRQSYRALQSGQYYCEAQNKHGSERSAAVSVTLNGSGSVIPHVAVGVGCFGLGVFLSSLFRLRCKRQKKKADEGDYQNAGLSDKDDTYAALDPTGRTSDDVYHTLAGVFGVPSLPVSRHRACSVSPLCLCLATGRVRCPLSACVSPQGVFGVPSLPVSRHRACSVSPLCLCLATGRVRCPLSACVSPQGVFGVPSLPVSRHRACSVSPLCLCLATGRVRCPLSACVSPQGVFGVPSLPVSRHRACSVSPLCLCLATGRVRCPLSACVSPQGVFGVPSLPIDN